MKIVLDVRVAMRADFSGLSHFGKTLWTKECRSHRQHLIERAINERHPTPQTIEIGSF